MTSTAIKSKIIARIVRAQSKEIYAGEWHSEYSDKIVSLYAIPMTEQWRVNFKKHRGARYSMNDYKETGATFWTLDEAIVAINQFIEKTNK